MTHTDNHIEDVLGSQEAIRPDGERATEASSTHSAHQCVGGRSDGLHRS